MSETKVVHHNHSKKRGDTSTSDDNDDDAYSYTSRDQHLMITTNPKSNGIQQTTTSCTNQYSSDNDSSILEDSLGLSQVFLDKCVLSQYNDVVKAHNKKDQVTTTTCTSTAISTSTGRRKENLGDPKCILKRDAASSRCKTTTTRSKSTSRRRKPTTCTTSTTGITENNSSVSHSNTTGTGTKPDSETISSTTRRRVRPNEYQRQQQKRRDNKNEKSNTTHRKDPQQQKDVDHNNTQKTGMNKDCNRNSTTIQVVTDSSTASTSTNLNDEKIGTRQEESSLNPLERTTTTSHRKSSGSNHGCCTSKLIESCHNEDQQKPRRRSRSRSRSRIQNGMNHRSQSNRKLENRSKSEHISSVALSNSEEVTTTTQYDRNYHLDIGCCKNTLAAVVVSSSAHNNMGNNSNYYNHDDLQEGFSSNKEKYNLLKKEIEKVMPPSNQNRNTTNPKSSTKNNKARSNHKANELKPDVQTCSIPQHSKTTTSTNNEHAFSESSSSPDTTDIECDPVIETSCNVTEVDYYDNKENELSFHEEKDTSVIANNNDDTNALFYTNEDPNSNSQNECDEVDDKNSFHHECNDDINVNNIYACDEVDDDMNRCHENIHNENVGGKHSIGFSDGGGNESHHDVPISTIKTIDMDSLSHAKNSTVQGVVQIEKKKKGKKIKKMVSSTKQSQQSYANNSDEEESVCIPTVTYFNPLDVTSMDRDIEFLTPLGLETPQIATTQPPTLLFDNQFAMNVEEEPIQYNDDDPSTQNESYYCEESSFVESELDQDTEVEDERMDKKYKKKKSSKKKGKHDDGNRVVSHKGNLVDCCDSTQDTSTAYTSTRTTKMKRNKSTQQPIPVEASAIAMGVKLDDYSDNSDENITLTHQKNQKYYLKGHRQQQQKNSSGNKKSSFDFGLVGNSSENSSSGIDYCDYSSDHRSSSRIGTKNKRIATMLNIGQYFSKSSSHLDYDGDDSSTQDGGNSVVKQVATRILEKFHIRKGR